MGLCIRGCDHGTQDAGVARSADGKRQFFAAVQYGIHVVRRIALNLQRMFVFNDNQRLHIFAVDVATKQVRQLTKGIYDEHSIDWSPDGKEILFASNREPNQDEFFNYDIFTLNVADNSIRRLTATEYNEYGPLWSPDGKHIAYRGTTRGLTDRETTMEDTHVWLMNADGSDRHEIGGVIDNRQGSPKWAPDSSAVYFTVQARGSNHLVRLPIGGGGAVFIAGPANNKRRGGEGTGGGVTMVGGGGGADTYS